MGLIRAKFRCLGIEKTWDDITKVHLAPVMASDGHPENSRFWSATPTGEADLKYRGEAPFEPGDFYYIDMAPFDEKDYWTLNQVTLCAGGAGEVSFTRYGTWDPKLPLGLIDASLKMYIEPPETLKLFGEPGSKWQVTFSFAEKSRD